MFDLFGKEVGGRVLGVSSEPLIYYYIPARTRFIYLGLSSVYLWVIPWTIW